MSHWIINWTIRSKSLIHSEWLNERVIDLVTHLIFQSNSWNLLICYVICVTWKRLCNMLLYLWNTLNTMTIITVKMCYSNISSPSSGWKRSYFTPNLLTLIHFSDLLNLIFIISKKKYEIKVKSCIIDIKFKYKIWDAKLTRYHPKLYQPEPNPSFGCYFLAN